MLESLSARHLIIPFFSFDLQLGSQNVVGANFIKISEMQINIYSVAVEVNECCAFKVVLNIILIFI